MTKSSKLTNSPDIPSQLPQELKSLVRKTITLLGEVIKEEGGVKVYNQVEKIRKEMAIYRTSSDGAKNKSLDNLYSIMNKYDEKTQHAIATSFSLMLEIMNVCESAYRTYKIREKKIYKDLPKTDNTIVFVLTAHPTEVRTTYNTVIFDRIQSVATRLLEGTGEEEYLLSLIKHNIKLAWLVPMTKHKKPEVIDEANHLFSIVLRRDILDSILRTNRDACSIRIRTWVGGDKDGHPGIDEKVMKQCLEASRTHLIRFSDIYLSEFANDLKMLELDTLVSETTKLKSFLSKLVKIKSGDFDNVNEFKKKISYLQTQYQKNVGSPNPRLNKLHNLMELFPALVIPIELREDSEIIAEALKSKTKINISRMLECLKLIAGKHSIRNYAQGLIISMCQTYDDFLNAVALQKKYIGRLDIPVIPLFETAQALEDSDGVVKEMIKNQAYTKDVTSKWNNRLEVMLGYSDSSKGMGVFPSRLNIAKTMRKLDVLISKAGFVPVFFHGSGGSVDRGGGKLQDQTAWWPKSALDLYKATVQGEMVERYFTSPEVYISNVSKIITNAEKSKGKKGLIKILPVLDEFSDSVKVKYSSKLKEPIFMEMVEKSTPYSYLNVLKLGSRPTKRSKVQGPLDFSSIRAIPWILCWTQTRVLFPSWWGIGSTWEEFKRNPKKVKELKEAYLNSNLFSSFVRTLGFSMAKIEFNIFELYLRKSNLSQDTQKQIISEFSSELRLAKEFVKTVTGEKDLLWHTPWLEDSITLRSSMIHPLNILQIIGHQKDDSMLVRKSVAGISCGMLTTG